MMASSSATTPGSTDMTAAVVMARASCRTPQRPPISIPADSATSSMMSATSMPACTAVASGRSDQTQALTSMSTSRLLGAATRESLIAAVISGFSMGRPPPPPEQ